ncbi:MAG TPA: non-ribosomal peptide synthetase [Woeseiaceae bacterium]|nr:non-ribosomal peptide synthetase [Woeseiaceae bacterium]
MKLYDNLTSILREAASQDRSIRFIDGDKEESVLSFADLWRHASTMLAALQSRGMTPGDELIIFTRSNRSFVIAFWAAILGGIVPVPVAVGISDEHKLKLFRILGQLRRATFYTEQELLERLVEFAGERNLADVSALLQQRVLLENDVAGSAEGRVCEPQADDLAFIQYSSGSTSDPKGVCLTHRNLTSNIRAIIEGAAWTDQDRSLSWMPLTHDMGLIGFHLSVLAAHMDHAVMDTGVFVRRPLLWMSRATELESTQLCSPNFGYKHYLRMFQHKGTERHTLDLAAVRTVMNGAEPISYDLCEEFLDALEPFGLKRTAMFPVYGLAEATVAVSFPAPGSLYSRVVINRHSLRIGSPYESAEPGGTDAVSFVKVGKAVRDCQIRITDDGDRPLPDKAVGHIQIKGQNITSGLYNDAEAERSLFTADGWLRSGDCGVLVDGELVITGRSKDILIVNGQNYYPHDIEEIIAEIDGLDLGKVVVCGVSAGDTPTEELLVFLLYRQQLDSFPALAHTVRTTVGTHAGLEIDHVIPVTRIPKTTSGKIQRGHLARAYLDGEFASVLASIEPSADETALDLDEDDPLIVEIEQICREFSKDRHIGPDDNLFEVGVSSLTLTEIVLAIDEKHPGKVDISDLFDYPTIRQLADFLRR